MLNIIMLYMPVKSGKKCIIFYIISIFIIIGGYI